MTDPLASGAAGDRVARVAVMLDGLRVRATVRQPRRRPSDAELLAGLRALAATLGRSYLTDADLIGRKGLSGTVLRRRFGSRRAAFVQAGLALRPVTDRYTDLECFANMAALWRLRGGPPRALDADRPPSKIGFGAYRARSGTWKRAVEAYAAFTGADPTRPGPPGRIGVAREETEPAPGATLPGATPPAADGGARDEATGPRRRSRQARSGKSTPLGLRFKVLQRDRFRCVACGNSPVHDAACVLQVDHIKPRAQGGDDRIENLRALCGRCNLGRGAREEEKGDDARNDGAPGEPGAAPGRDA